MLVQVQLVTPNKCQSDVMEAVLGLDPSGLKSVQVQSFKSCLWHQNYGNLAEMD